MNRSPKFIWLAVMLISGCAAPPPEAAKSDFAGLYQALDTNQDGKISQEEFLAGVKDPEQAAKIFEMCDHNQDAFLTLNEAGRQNWAIRQLLRLTPPPKLSPPPAGKK